VVAASSALSRTYTLVRGPDADGKAIWSHAQLDRFWSMATLQPFSAKSLSLFGSSRMADPSLNTEPRSPNSTEAHAGYIAGVRTTHHHCRWSAPSR
jgi:hypothetical protein